MHHSRNYRAGLALSGIVVGLAATAACKDKPTREETATAPATSVAASSSAQGDGPRLEKIEDIPARLTFEAAARPKGAVTSTQVYDALAAQGMVLTERQQHVAKAFNAVYCEGAKAEQAKQFLSVCEYTDVASAEKGVADAKRFGTKQRDVIRNGQSVLILRYVDGADPAPTEKTFMSLKAPPAKP